MTGRKLSDVERWQAAGMVIGGMSYRQTAERFNVSHSIIVRLKQRVNQTRNVKERQRTWQPLKTTLCTTLDSVNEAPSIDTILIKLCVLLTMPVASATAEMPFSVLRRLKTYVRSTMKNDSLSSLGLMHILTEILKWTCTKQWRCSYLLRHKGQMLDNFKKFLSIKVIKIVLDSMLYETLKWTQIAPFWISSKKITDPLPLSRIMACTLLCLSYVPGSDRINKQISSFCLTFY
jgi:hypothetical protein